MTSHAEQLLLGLTFVQVGGNTDGWRLSEYDVDKERFDYYLRIARLVDDALLHLFFLGDNVSGVTDIAPGWSPSPEPLVLATALATHTRHIGFAPSASSVYSDPYQLARQLATIDHLSEGRAAWNILTSFYPDSASKVYQSGRRFRYEERYEISEEFLRVIDDLWNGWDPRARLLDRESGYYADPAKVRWTAHRGDFFEVEGALNITSSPQRIPVKLVPVATPRGVEFAGRHADIVFTNRNTVDDARELREQLRAAAVENGREPESVKLLPGAAIVIGETDADARRLFERVLPFVDPQKAKESILKVFGWEKSLGDGSRTAEWPALAPDASHRARALYARASSGDLTLGELALEASSSRNFPLFVGSAQTVASDLERWLGAGAVDGFLVGPLFTPDGIDGIAQALVPELQRRGAFRSTAPERQTLRDALGVGG